MRGTSDRSDERQRILAGSLALLFYALHVLHSFSIEHGALSLWICHLGSFLVGCGHLGRRASLNAVGFLWLSAGTPLWAWGLSTGHEELLWTSCGTHLGGWILGLHGLVRLGLPPRAWLRAILGVIPPWALARWITPPAENINFAHRIYPSIDDRLTSYPLFLGGVVLGLGFYFFLVEIVLRPLLSRGSAGPP